MLFRYWMYFIAFLVSVSCAQNHGQKSKEALKLMGTWKVDYATRSNRQTQLLNDMYLKFDNDILELNLPDTNKYSYTYRNDSIFIFENELQLIEILFIDESELNVGFDYKNHYFQLFLHKSP